MSFYNMSANDYNANDYNANDYNDDEFKKNVQDYVIKSFNKHYEHNNFLKLLFITSIDGDECYIFNMDGILIRYNTDDDDIWSTIPKIELATTNVTTYGKVEKYDIPILSDDSSKNIRYELYPFEQTCEIPLNGLDMHDNDLKQLEFKFIDYEVKIIDERIEKISDKDTYLTGKCEWKDEFVLWIIDGTYAIEKNNQIISMFIDEKAVYQLGDGSTECFLYNNKDLIIVNDGDVSSVVVVFDDGA